MEELQRQAGWAKSFGLPVELVSAREAQQLFPPMDTAGVLGAAFLPQDGYLDPSQLTFALADGARLRGAEIEQRTRVTGITLRDGRVHEVVTDKGSIRTDVVINAGGMYAPQIARMVGVDVPIVAYAHEFLVTEAFDPALPALPTLRDPDNLVYWRTEVGGLIMGGYERDPAPWALDGVPDGFEAQLLPEDWERFEELLTNSIKRVPSMEQAEVRKLFNGPEAFTPDGEFILGESDVPGFWVAAGFCAHGLAGAGGMGWQMAEWIVTASPASTSGTWTSAVSAASTAARPTRWRGRPRYTPPTTTSSTPTTSARRPAAAAVAGLPAAGGAGRLVRREVGLGAGELVRSQRCRGRPVAAPARLGGRALVARHPRRGDRHPRAGRAVRRELIRQVRGARAGRAGTAPASLRQRRRSRGRDRSPTRRC